MTGVRGVLVDIDLTQRLDQALRERDLAEARAGELMLAGQRFIASADAAKRKVIRDLHDGAQQRLVNTVIELQLGLSRWEEGSEQVRDHVAAALTEAQASLNELRELAAGIHPSILINRGLGAAIVELVHRVPVHVDLHCDTDQRLPETVEASAYFFVCEALANAVKHARASHITVRIQPGRDVLVIDVIDDGIGGVALDSGSGTGLSGLAARVTALGGLLVIHSPAGVGTNVHAELPLVLDEKHPRPRPHIRPDGSTSPSHAGTGQPEDAPPVRVLRAGQGPVVEGGVISGTILGGFNTPCIIGELHRVPMPAGLHQVSGAHPTGVRELVHVHHGTVRVGPVTGPVELGSGDFADYAADVPHLYEVVRENALATVLMLRFGGQGPLP